MEAFSPPALLRNSHLMTIAPTFWPRRYARLGPCVRREFEVEPGSRILGECHWQTEPRRHPTLVMIHGLEGSCQSGYMMGTAEKAWMQRFNVVRLNQRNCGDTATLTPTLYNSSRSGDVARVVEELLARDGLPEIFAAGFSMGGNLVLKMAGEYAGNAPPGLRAVAAISPAMDLAACVDALEERRNRLYQIYFVRRLLNRFQAKVRQYPEIYTANGLGRIRTVREFDEAVTAPYCGFLGATDYYARASARPLLAAIRLPTLLLTAQDDTLIPFSSFADPTIGANQRIKLDAPPHGGHCGFVSRDSVTRFWAEARVVEFCLQHSQLPAA
jgi:predicted alpha/beta-fold hydrolase